MINKILNIYYYLVAKFSDEIVALIFFAFATKNKTTILDSI